MNKNLFVLLTSLLKTKSKEAYQKYVTSTEGPQYYRDHRQNPRKLHVFQTEAMKEKSHPRTMINHQSKQTV